MKKTFVSGPVNLLGLIIGFIISKILEKNNASKLVKEAKKNGVKIGAHPSFPDKEGFGRKPIDISCAALFKSLEDQTNRLLKHLKDANAALHHIKPHGALYNLAAKDERTANIVVELMKCFVLVFIGYCK